MLLLWAVDDHRRVSSLHLLLFTWHQEALILTTDVLSHLLSGIHMEYHGQLTIMISFWICYTVTAKVLKHVFPVWGLHELSNLHEFFIRGHAGMWMPTHCAVVLLSSICVCMYVNTFIPICVYLITLIRKKAEPEEVRILLWSIKPAIIQRDTASLGLIWAFNNSDAKTATVLLVTKITFLWHFGNFALADFD